MNRGHGYAPSSGTISDSARRALLMRADARADDGAYTRISVRPRTDRRTWKLGDSTIGRSRTLAASNVCTRPPSLTDLGCALTAAVIGRSVVSFRVTCRAFGVTNGSP